MITDTLLLCTEYRDLIKSTSGRSRSVDVAYLWLLEKKNDL